MKRRGFLAVLAAPVVVALGRAVTRTEMAPTSPDFPHLSPSFLKEIAWRFKRGLSADRFATVVIANRPASYWL